MGASLSWLVCDAKHANSLQALLGASEKSEGDEASFCVTFTPEEKLCIFEARGRSWTFTREDERKRLSAGREIVFCMLEEHVMASEAALWRNGVEIWRVEHECEKGTYHLDVRGALPPSFQSIKQTRVEEQDKEGGEDSDVDLVIAVPMELAAKATSFDGEIHDPDGEYHEWSCPRPRKLVGFFGRLFGKRN